MTIIFMMFVFLCHVTYRDKNSFSQECHEDFFSFDNLLMVNGIFVFLIFLWHFLGYVIVFFEIDSIYLLFNSFLCQCVVSSFLLCSGYGITVQLKKNKIEYTQKLITRWIFSLCLKFIICVLLYVILSFVIENKLTLKQILLSFIALDFVENSDCYIFYMFCSYLMIYFSFRFTDNEKIRFVFV